MARVFVPGLFVAYTRPGRWALVRVPALALGVMARALPNAPLAS